MKNSSVSSRWRTLLPCGFILLALFGGIAQGVPLDTTFNYQGRLIDSGSPPTDNYDFIFSLFDVATGGSPVGAPSIIPRDRVGVTNGMFTVLLNFGSDAFAGNARWLQIEVRKFGSGVAHTPLTPRQLLTLTPYALYSINAGSATTASSVPWSALTSIPAGIGSGWGLTGNEGTTDANFLGTMDPRPFVLRVDGLRVLRLEPGLPSPNLIGGGFQNHATAGVRGATIGGGGEINFESELGNIVNDDFGTVGGGRANTAGSSSSGGIYATVSGGSHNTASGSSSTVSGGYRNTSSGYFATVSGGLNNTSSGNYGMVPGGDDNAAAGEYSFAAGFQAKANHLGSFVWADVSSSSPFASTAPNQFSIRARGGLRLDESTSLSFGYQTRQMLDLWGPGYGIGVQAGTFYQRTGGGFAWHKQGSHSDTSADPGVGGIRLMGLDDRFLAVRGVGNEQAYLGGDGAGNDVQIGSLNGSIANVAFYNAVNGNYMNLICKTITITGGADLAEPFEMSSKEIPEGAVVIIDRKNPGRLKMSDHAYDTHVAGIVSGAGGINPGIQLKQEGVLENGQNVALTGRVYALADASTGPIEPGDLLTTSNIPGHAMKVSDPAKAQGAILGKAMGSLRDGRGMVLVLVTLQ